MSTLGGLFGDMIECNRMQENNVSEKPNDVGVPVPVCRKPEAVSSRGAKPSRIMITMRWLVR
jgi:hypothetical protein